MGFFSKLFNRFKLTPEQRHIKSMQEDPLYREVFHRQMEEGRKIRDKSKKEYKEYLDSTLDYCDDQQKLKDENKEKWENTFGKKLKESSTDDNAEQTEVNLTQDLINRMNHAEQIEVSEEKIKKLREIREQIKKDE